MGGLWWREGGEATRAQQRQADEQKGHLAHREEGIAGQAVQQRVAGAEQLVQEPQRLFRLCLIVLPHTHDGVFFLVRAHLLDELAQHVQVRLH